MKIVVYTAIFGNYDQLKEQPQTPGVQYLCFTDNPNFRSRSWQVIPCRAPNEHPRISAKRLKTMPHRYMQGADISIWIDGSIVIFSPNFLHTAISSLDRWGIACMKHPCGNCIFQEAEGCCHMQKYLNQPVLAQAQHYREQGYPENNGLAACGIIVRDMRNAKVAKIGEDWWLENQNWTYQDQISFPFVLWRNNHWFDTLKIDYSDRSSFVLCDHNSEG